LRFILDSYHILIFETNGLYVSDFYIRLNIDRIFSNKFLSYESKSKLKKKKKVFNAKDKDFLGVFPIKFPDITKSSEGHKLMINLTNK
jgi:hypothetical protein